MHIHELAEILHLILVIQYHSKVKRYHCQFQDTAISKQGMFYSPLFGIGSTPEEAIRDYVEKIRSKRLVTGVGTPYGRKIDILEELTY
jgi:hypothetical protein